MCGIAAYFAWREPVGCVKGILKKMCDLQASRGPDGEGQICFDHGGLGHRRLAILDPESGMQPMSIPGSGLHLSFNGEIYNFRELRALLEGCGHHFITQTDSEVVLHAFQEWGESCVTRMRGMFAFVIYDALKDELFGARDHLGIKPFVYATNNGKVAVASSIRALKAVPWLDTEVNTKSIALYLHLGYVPAPESVMKGVQKLPPGHCIWLRKNGVEAVPRAYWELQAGHNVIDDPREWVEEVELVCRESVKAHLVSDVPFGAFLSGGVDSTLIVSWMRSILNQRIQAFTISYADRDHDETAYAIEAAEVLQIDLFCQTVDENSLDLLPVIVGQLGEPLADRSMVSMWHVSEMARRKVPMVLSGDGGDEFFFGYESYFGWMVGLDNRRSLSKKPMSLRLRQILHYLRPNRFAEIGPDHPTVSSLWGSMAQFPKSVLKPMLVALGDSGEPHPTVSKTFNNNDWEETLLQECDWKMYLPHNILFKVDSASMAHGLEVRTPLVDVKVAEMASRLPLRHRKGTEKGTIAQWEQGKSMLKQILRKQFPDTFVNRPKKGFVPPISRWTAKGTLGHDVALERLLGVGGKLKELIGPRALRGAVEYRNGARVWQLLVLEEWLSQNQ